MTTQQSTGDDLSTVRQALGWAPADGPEEQAAHARLGGQSIPDEEPVNPPAETPSPAASTPVPVIPGGDAPNLPKPDPAAMAAAQQAQEQQMISAANAAALQYKNTLIAQKWDEAAAHQAATQFARNHYLEAQNRHMTQQREQQAQVDTAQHFGRQYNVDPTLLLEYSNPAAMEAAAKRLKAQDDRLAAINGNPTPRTPVQQFDSGSGGGMTDQQKKIAYATGQINLTTKEYHELYRR